MVGPPARPRAWTITGGQPLFMFTGRSHPQAGQGVEQVLNRPLAQALGAGEDIAAMSQGRHGAQESHGSAGVAQIDRRIRHLEIPARALQPDRHSPPS